jgi:hypothetical protein
MKDGWPIRVFYDLIPALHFLIRLPSSFYASAPKVIYLIAFAASSAEPCNSTGENVECPPYPLPRQHKFSSTDWATVKKAGLVQSDGWLSIN